MVSDPIINFTTGGRRIARFVPGYSSIIWGGCLLANGFSCYTDSTIS